VPSQDFDRIIILLDELDETVNIVKKTSSAPLDSLVGMDQVMQKLEKSMNLNENELLECRTSLEIARE